jgi:hypothetical protein
MSDPQLSGHDLALVEAVAQRVLELLGERDARSRLVSAGALAALLGRTREWVYDHAEDLGGRRIGDGERPRLWFDVDRALSGRLTSGGSQPPDPPAVTGQSRHRRRRATGSDVPLLPVGGQNGGHSSKVRTR